MLAWCPPSRDIGGRKMASGINEIVAPVVEQLRGNASSGVSDPKGKDAVRQKNSVTPSPSENVKNEDEKPSRETVEETLVKANELARKFSRELSFSYDERIDRVVVTVREGGTDKVVRQLPPEEMIRLSEKMDDIMGMLINQSA
jgi:flagellar protein FlaG